jgi:hypothetical protein
MCCWFCESPLRRGPAGFYCPFEACPACKADGGDSALDGPEPERWRRMREGGTLADNLAGLPVSPRSDH